MKGENIEIIYKNWLYHVPGIGRLKFRYLLEMTGSAMALYGMSHYEMKGLIEKGKLSISDIERINEYKNTCDPFKLWQRIRGRGITVSDENSPGYPKRLLDIPDRPVMLYQIIGNAECYLDGMDVGKERALQPGSGKVNKYGGTQVCDVKSKDDSTNDGKHQREYDELRHPALAVIGSRICTEYGRMVAARIGRECARLDIELVSGMAVGIDGISQRAALEAGGRVTAVLGSGADVCYPKENVELYNGLKKNGRIVSEYIPGTKPVSGNFPQRNRIISGLADAVIVVEAKEKSGTMITVDMALEQGRQVYIIPGRLTDPLSAGCNRLISQGAEIIWNLGECLERFSISHSVQREEKKGDLLESDTELTFIPPGLSTKERIVWDVLDAMAMGLQEIYERINEKTEMPISILQGTLLSMELMGCVGVDGTRFYRKIF